MAPTYEPLVNVSKERERYYADLQSVLGSCTSYAEMKTKCPDNLPYKLDLNPPVGDNLKPSSEDIIDRELLAFSFGTMNMRSYAIIADGNCWPRTASFVSSGEEDLHVEMRVRTVQELIAHDNTYLDDKFLADGISDATINVSATYAQYSPKYTPGTRVDDREIRLLYEQEVMDVIRPNAFCGIWQMHALASVIGTPPVKSLYPGLGPPRLLLCRSLMPRLRRSDHLVHILWTSTSNANPQT